jgi:hypothetical protein
MSSSSPTISNQSLEDRVAYLESLFLLTTSKSDPASSSLPSSSLLAEVAALKKQLARAEYRIEHLCKALEAVKGTAATEDLLKLK